MLISVINNKGGVGKTTVSSSLIYELTKRGTRLVGVDADVDAPDLDLFLGEGKILEETSIETSMKAKLDVEKCIGCLKCLENCPYNAITKVNGKVRIEKIMCEGCGVCSLVCPVNAVELHEEAGGKIKVVDYGHYKVVSGQLNLGEHNSGKLVSMVRGKAVEIAKKENLECIIVDGAPGIGCPVISSLTGADMAILVTEPTYLALAGLKRLSEVIEHFKIPAGIVINKYDISQEMSNKIEEFARKRGYEILEKIPIDYKVVEAMANMKPLPLYDSKSPASIKLQELARKLMGEVK